MEQVLFTVLVLGLLLVITVFLFGMIFWARTNQQAVMYGVTIVSLLGITLGSFCNQAKIITASGGNTRLVLISVDGLGYNQLRFLPKTMTFFDRSYRVKGVTPTLTYPSHTTLLTGVSPARHGIRNNTVFDPKHVESQAWQWYASDIQVPTLFDYCASRGQTTMNLQWPVTVGNAHITYSLPVIWRSGTPEDLKLIQSLMRPKVNLTALILQTAKKRPSADELAGILGDEVRSMIAKNWLISHEPFFSAVYFGALDHMSHRFGPLSREVKQTLHQLDSLLSDLVRFIQLAEPSCRIVIVSDHSLAPVHSTVDLYADLDVSPDEVYIWSGDGCAALYILPNVSMTRAVLKQKLDQLRYIEQVRIGGDDDGTFKDADIFVALKLGYLIRQSQHENLEQKGAHGYLSKHAEMDAVLLLSNNAQPFPFPSSSPLPSRIPITAIAPYLLNRILFP